MRNEYKFMQAHKGEDFNLTHKLIRYAYSKRDGLISRKLIGFHVYNSLKLSQAQNLTLTNLLRDAQKHGFLTYDAFIDAKYRCNEKKCFEFLATIGTHGSEVIEKPIMG